MFHVVLSSSVFSLGNATDKLTYHKGRSFTTKDQDNDSSSINCEKSVDVKGACFYHILFSSIFSLGNATDKLTKHHNGCSFSTKDHDNDVSTTNCAADVLIRGAWWFGDCKTSNLNGVYRNGADDGTMVWGAMRPIKEAEMKIRPVDF